MLDLVTKPLLEIGRRYGPFVVLGVAYLVPHNGTRRWFVTVEEDGKGVDVVRVAHVRRSGGRVTPRGWRRAFPRLYSVWTGLISRCEHPSDTSYKYYGRKGVAVCSEWREDFTAFLRWAVAHGYAPNMTVDRRDPNGNYSPSNCRILSKADNCSRRVAA
jgi:hypothetical protein